MEVLLMDDIFNNLISVYPDPLKRLSVFIEIFKNSGYNEQTQTVSGGDSHTHFVLRMYALGYIANTVPYINFDSSSQAISLIETLKPLFESQFSDSNMSGDDFSYIQLIYTKCIADISTRGSLVPEVNDFYCEMLPLPVVAQYLYQDGSRSDEILYRNNQNIRHPLFCQGVLEVLVK